MRQGIHGTMQLGCFLALCITMNASVISQQVRYPDWPRFLGTGIDGHAPESSMEIDWSKSPRVLWSMEVGDGYGIGSIMNGQYFHFDSVVSEGDGGAAVGRVERLRCVDLDSGVVAWTVSDPLSFRDLYGYETGPRSSPTIGSVQTDGTDKTTGQIFTLGVRGDLVCRSVSDGEPSWKADTSGIFSVVQNFFGVGSAPLLVDDLVIVMVGGSPKADLQIAPGRLDRVSPNGTGLVAFDRESGKVRWKSVDDLASYSSPRPITLDGMDCVLLFARDHLWCVEAATGTTRWKLRHRDTVLESVNAMTPVVKGDQIFISECYGVGSVMLKATLDSVEVVWKDDPRRRREMAMRSHWSTPVLRGGFLFGCSGRNAPDSDFRCVEWATGKVLWKDLSRRRSSVTRVKERLMVLEERGTLHVAEADPSGWNPVAKFDFANGDFQDASGQPVRLQYPCWSAPVIVGNRAIIRGDQTVLCLQWPNN